MSFISDMDENGFAHERCQELSCDLSFEVRGKIAPFLEVTLGRSKALICDRTCVVQHDYSLSIKSWPGLGGSRWLVVNLGDKPEASVILTTSQPGCAGAFNLADYSGKLICLADCLMANGPGVTASYYARFQKMGLSLVILEGDGWAFLRSRGDVFEIQMLPGEKLCVRAQNVAVMTATVDFESVASIGETPAGDGQLEFVTLTGPGRIWMQSVSRSREQNLTGLLAPNNTVMREIQKGGVAISNGTSA